MTLSELISLNFAGSEEESHALICLLSRLEPRLQCVEELQASGQPRQGTGYHKLGERKGGNQRPGHSSSSFSSKLFPLHNNSSKSRRPHRTRGSTTSSDRLLNTGASKVSMEKITRRSYPDFYKTTTPIISQEDHNNANPRTRSSPHADARLVPYRTILVPLHHFLLGSRLGLPDLPELRHSQDNQSAKCLCITAPQRDPP